MLTAIRASDLKQIPASYCTKAKDFYICPVCHQEVILKHGLIKIAHFAHKSSEACEYGAGESEEHRQCKTEIYEHLARADYLECALEKSMGAVRPDIFFKSKRTGKQYAVEVQLSTLPLERIIARTQEYNRLGVHVLWLPQYSKKLEANRYSPHIWERWLHTVYYGRIYYWISGTTINAYQFDKYRLYVEATEYGGGYFKTSKRYKKAKFLGSLDILNDFQGIKRKGWNDGPIVVPTCSILLDSTLKLPLKG